MSNHDTAITSTSRSISHRSNASDGFHNTKAKLRSILMHPMGIFLTALLNDVERPNYPDPKFMSVVNSAVNDLPYQYDVGSDRDCILAAAILEWSGKKETDLTETIYSYLHALSTRGRIKGYSDNDRQKLTFEGEQTIATGNTTGGGRMDFVISETNVPNDKPSIVAIIEVGIHHDLWWEKTDQILRYVNSIRTTQAEKSKFNFDQPILLTVMTVSRSNEVPTTGDPKKRKFSQEDAAVDKAVTEYDTQKEEFGKSVPPNAAIVRFGVFLCTPKADVDYRIALLWRKHTTCLKDASRQFGKLLHAFSVCARLGKTFATKPTPRNVVDTQGQEIANNLVVDDAVMGTFSDEKADTTEEDTHRNDVHHDMYEYLGPNCCKIGNFLYRCYDNRLRPTERRPDLYGASLNATEKRLETTNGSCTTVLDISDENLAHSPILPFGALPATDDGIDWLWWFRGQVKVIATEYHEGVHYAKHPKHFLPIINHLEQLHCSGYVHGDIRAYNMVFHYPEREPSENEQESEGKQESERKQESESEQKYKGWLIDFDYGGRMTDNLKYPKGYVKSLPDGLRKREGGQPITYDDDWYALGYIMFRLHVIKFPKDFKDIAKIRNMLSILQEEFLDKKGNFDSLEEGAANYLRSYIAQVPNVAYLDLLESFEESLVSYHLINEQRPRINSKGATGSPPPKKV